MKDTFGQAAVGVPFAYWPTGSRDETGRPRLRAATDASGVQTITELRPGSWSLRVANQSASLVEVAANQQTEHIATVRLAGRFTVRCVDAAGSPVAGATILLWPASNVMEPQRVSLGTIVGRTNGAGKLTIASVPPPYPTHSWIQARASTLGASLARTVPHASTVPKAASGARPREILLRIDRQTAVATLRAVDATGQAIAGADMFVIPIDTPSADGQNGDLRSPYVAAQATTDDRGTAIVAPLAAGRHEVRVRAATKGEAKRSFVSDGEHPIDLQIALVDEAALSGRVLATNGRPIRDALVRIRSQGARRRTRTGADGRFHFSGLAAGTVDWSVDQRLHAKAKGSIDIAAGEVATLPVRLQSLGELRGTVSDPSGQPLPGYAVELSCELPGLDVDRRTATTDPQGRFAISGQTDLSYRLALRAPDSHQRITLPDHEDVRVDQGPLHVTVPVTSQPSAYIAFRLLAADGSPALRDARIALLGDGRPLHVGTTLPASQRDDDAGRTRLGPVLPGSYTLRFSRSDRLRFEFQPVLVGASETVDLGDVRWPAHGIIAVTAERLPGGVGGDIMLAIEGPHDLGMKLAPADSAGIVTAQIPAIPGRWTVLLYGDGFPTQRTELLVAADQTASWRCLLPPAVRTPLRIHALPGNVRCQGELLGPDNSQVFDFELEPGQAYEDWAPNLGLGQHRFVATDDDGRQYTAELSIHSLQAAPERRAVRLQPRQ
ncbi:MAG: collagen binding domain-containing protein [Planctomycetota bacterium]